MREGGKWQMSTTVNNTTWYKCIESCHFTLYSIASLVFPRELQPGCHALLVWSLETQGGHLCAGELGRIQPGKCRVMVNMALPSVQRGTHFMFFDVVPCGRQCDSYLAGARASFEILDPRPASHCRIPPQCRQLSCQRLENF